MKPENSFRQGVLISIFGHHRITDLSREAIGPKGSNCLSRGLHTSISKETYSTVSFPGLPGLDLPSGSAQEQQVNSTLIFLL